MHMSMLMLVGAGVWLTAAGAEFPGALYQPDDPRAPSHLRLVVPAGFRLNADAHYPEGAQFTVTGLRAQPGEAWLGVSVLESRQIFPLAPPLRLTATRASAETSPAPDALKGVRLHVTYPLMESHPKDSGSWAKARAVLQFASPPALGAPGNYALLAYAASSPAAAHLVLARATNGAKPDAFAAPAPVQIEVGDERLIVLLVQDGVVLDHRVFSLAPADLPPESSAASLERQKLAQRAAFDHEQDLRNQSALETLKRGISANELLVATTVTQIAALKTQIFNRLRASLLDRGIVTNTAGLERRFNDALAGETTNEAAQTVAAIGAEFMVQWLELKQRRDLAEASVTAGQKQLAEAQRESAKVKTQSRSAAPATLEFTLAPMREPT